MKTNHPYTDLVPRHAARLYSFLEFGRTPGPFLEAILANNLAAAIVASETDEQHLIPNLVKWVLNYLPNEAWGSERKIQAWKRRGGFRGRHFTTFESFAMQ